MTHAAVVVRYEPDKGASYGQALRPTRPRGAWQALQTFLQDCAEVDGPEQIRLTAHRPTQFDDSSVSERCVKAAVARFGDPDSTTGGGFMFPSGEPVPGGHLEWTGDQDRLPQFLEFLFSGDPWPKTVVGPIAVSMTYRFLWRNPDSLKPLQEQCEGHLTADGCLRNTLAVSLERRSFVQPLLWFPYGPSDSRLADLIHLVTSQLPFKLSPRHFRVASPLKEGGGYSFRKFDAASLFAA